MLRVFIYLMFAIGLFGCSDSQDAYRKEMSPNDTSSSNYVISVNGKILTREMIDTRVAMMVKIRQLCSPLEPAELKKIKKTLTATYPDVFEDQTLRAMYATSVGLKVSDELLEKCRQRSVRNFRATKAKTWEALLKKISPYEREFTELVVGEATNLAIAEHLEKLNPLDLPEDYAEKEIQKLHAYNARMDATNFVVHARATNVWEQINGGMSFRLAAAKYSTLKQERKDKGKWAKLDWPQLDGELLTWAKKLKPGEYSPPIEGDNGLMILMVDSKDDKECELSRIYFSLPLFATIPTPESVVEEARRKHLQRLLKETYKEIRSTATIVKGRQKVPTLKAKMNPRKFKNVKKVKESK